MVGGCRLAGTHLRHCRVVVVDVAIVLQAASSKVPVRRIVISVLADVSCHVLLRGRLSLAGFILYNKTASCVMPEMMWVGDGVRLGGGLRVPWNHLY